MERGAIWETGFLIGGSWVGYPDVTTDFENAVFAVDYVRVYQKQKERNE